MRAKVFNSKFALLLLIFTGTGLSFFAQPVMENAG
jgi:hypothetical protein